MVGIRRNRTRFVKGHSPVSVGEDNFEMASMPWWGTSLSFWARCQGLSAPEEAGIRSWILKSQARFGSKVAAD